MQEALRTYVELAMGLTDASRKKFKKTVKDVVGKSGVTADQIKALTSELVASNSANREALSKLVRFEVDRALGVVGLATAEEVGELTGRVRDLERQLRAAETSSGSVVEAPAVTAARRTAAKKSAAKRATAAATLPDADATLARSTARGTANGAAGSTAKKSAAAKKTTPAKRTVTKSTGATTGAKTTGAKTTGAKTTGTRATARKAQS